MRIYKRGGYHGEWVKITTHISPHAKDYLESKKEPGVLVGEIISKAIELYKELEEEDRL